MACCLNPSRLALVALIGMGVAHSVLAQAMPDPTRPPGSTEYGTSGPVESGLQSIVRRQGEKPMAIIHGELIPLGGKVGEARLIAIHEDSVVLRAADGSRETLTMTPGISKTLRPAHSKSSLPREP